MRYLSLIVILALASACGTSSSTSSAADAGSDTYVGCNGDPRLNATSFPITLTSDDGKYTLTVQGAVPSVPLSGENTWTIAVTPVSGASPTVVGVHAAAFMPDHGHGSSKTPTFTLQQDGTWKAEHIYLTMAGIWRITFELTLSNKGSAKVVAFTCVAG